MTVDESSDVVEAHSEDEPLPLKTLCLQTLRILIPTNVSNLLWVSSQTITLAFVGKYLGALGTAQYCAGILFFNMAGFSFTQGFGAAIDTISSQAYGRDRKSPVVGETLQLALALDLVLWVFISIFFINCDYVTTVILGPEVGPGTAEFLHYCPLYLLVQILSGIVSKTMFAQKLPGLVAVANFVAACTSPIANYILTPWGIHGAALSLFVTVSCCALTHILCCVFHPRVIVREAPWPTPQLLEKEAWQRFLKISIPSVVATCAEWWAFEVQSIIAVTISPLSLAIHGVAMTLESFLFSAVVGICVAASVIVGNAVGGNRPQQAKRYAYFIITCDVVLGVLTIVVMVSFGGPIARLFSDDDHVVEGVKSLMPILALTHACDSLQSCLQGIFRGVGKPKQSGILVLVTLWGVGVPASALLVFVFHTGVGGCLGGLFVGFCFEIPALFLWMRRFNWEELSQRAQEAGAMDIILEASVTPEVKDSAASPTSAIVNATVDSVAVNMAVSEQPACMGEGHTLSSYCEEFLPPVPPSDER